MQDRQIWRSLERCTIIGSHNERREDPPAVEANSRSDFARFIFGARIRAARREVAFRFVSIDAEVVSTAKHQSRLCDRAIGKDNEFELLPLQPLRIIFHDDPANSPRQCVWLLE